MNTTESKGLMDANLIKSLKEANNVAFFHSDGAGMIRLEDKKGICTHIPVDSVMRGKNATYGHTYIMSALYSDVWQSIISLIKSGDVVGLDWRHNYYPFYR